LITVINFPPGLSKHVWAPNGTQPAGCFPYTSNLMAKSPYGLCQYMERLSTFW